MLCRIKTTDAQERKRLKCLTYQHWQMLAANAPAKLAVQDNRDSLAIITHRQIKIIH